MEAHNASQWFVREPALPGVDYLPGYTKLMLIVRQLTVPILVCGIVTNFVSCLVFSQAKVWRHYLSNYLRALSLNDMLLLISYAIASYTDAHIRSMAGCFASVFAYSLFAMLSPWLLVCITLDRALCVALPCSSRGPMFGRAPAAVISGMTGFCALANCHAFYTTVYRVDPAHNGSEVMNCKPRSGTEFVFIIDGVATAVLPGLAISLLCGFICCRVRRTCHRNVSGRPVAAPARGLQNQVTRMLLGFSLAYLLLNLPNCAAFLASVCLNAGVTSPRAFEAMNLARHLGQTLYFVHFSINSVVCAGANRKYRLAFHCLWRRLLQLVRLRRLRRRPLQRLQPILQQDSAAGVARDDGGLLARRRRHECLVEGLPQLRQPQNVCTL